MNEHGCVHVLAGRGECVGTGCPCRISGRRGPDGMGTRRIEVSHQRRHVLERHREKQKEAQLEPKRCSALTRTTVAQAGIDMSAAAIAEQMMRPNPQGRNAEFPSSLGSSFERLLRAVVWSLLRRQA